MDLALDRMFRVERRVFGCPEGVVDGGAKPAYRIVRQRLAYGREESDGGERADGAEADPTDSRHRAHRRPTAFQVHAGEHAVRNVRDVYIPENGRDYMAGSIR